MDVLRFECPDYRASREGTLSLVDPKELTKGVHELNPEVGQTEWKERHPVLFETPEYQFAVEFHHLHDTADEKHRPRVRHRMKAVGENFKFYPNGRNSGILVGAIDFLNSPGKFAFAFEYRDEQDSLQSGQMELYVASPKLDTKNVPVNVPVNVSNLASMLGVSEKTIKRDISAMQSAGLIKRVGSDKKGHWEIK